MIVPLGLCTLDLLDSTVMLSIHVGRVVVVICYIVYTVIWLDSIYLCINMYILIRMHIYQHIKLNACEPSL